MPSPPFWGGASWSRGRESAACHFDGWKEEHEENYMGKEELINAAGSRMMSIQKEGYRAKKIHLHFDHRKEKEEVICCQYAEQKQKKKIGKNLQRDLRSKEKRRRGEYKKGGGGKSTLQMCVPGLRPDGRDVNDGV